MNNKKINLYTCLPKDYQDRISLSFCLRVFMVIFGLLLIGYFYLKISVFKIENDMQKLISTKTEKRFKMNELRKKHPKVAKSVALQSSLNTNKEIFKLHVDLNKQLSNKRFSNEEGFSKYFSGLSRHIIDNLWLTEIKVQKGGTFLVLKGRTNNVSNVQNLMKQLETDESFNDVEIKLKKIETSSSNTGHDDFTLEIVPEEQDVKIAGEE